MNNNFNNLSKEKLMSALSGNSGVDLDKISSAINKGDVNEVLNSLNESDAEKLKSLLENKDALNKLLSSDKFSNMLKQFMK